jgi:TatA/E family protein of Tat protein translocase
LKEFRGPRLQFTEPFYQLGGPPALLFSFPGQSFKLTQEELIMDLFAPSHLLLLLLVILVIFGPSKLGDVGGALGKGIRDFKRAINEPDSKLGEN